MSVKYALLSLLYHQPAHGYALHERFETSLGNRWDLNPGQIYTTLDRLEREALVTHEEVEQDTGPDKKVYTLTPKGERELQSWLTAPAERSDRLRDELYVKLTMGLITNAVSLEHIIQAQRRGLFRELRRLTLQRARCDWKQDAPILLLLDSALMHLEADLQWLSLYESRLSDLRSYAWPAPQPRPRGRPPRPRPLESDQEADEQE